MGIESLVVRVRKRARPSFRRGRSVVVATAVFLVACGGRILAESTDPAPAATVTAPPVATATAKPPLPDPPDARRPLPPVKPSLPDSAQIVDLGNHQSGDVVTFTIPPNTLGFQLVIQAKNEGTDTVSVERLESPAAEVVFSDGKPRGTEVPTAYGIGWASAAVPQADVYRKSPVEPGQWKATIFTDSPSARVHLSLQSTSDGFFHGGELDLHVYVPEGLRLSKPGAEHEVTIEDAPFDPALNARIDAFYSMMDDLTAIGRGNVYFHGIPASFSSIDIESDHLLEAFRETRVSPDGQAMHVVFTNDLGGYALGVAPAIPGNAMETGTSLSAIAVTQFEGSSPELDAYTMVHELGHFVGLSHTSEFTDGNQDGGYHDPLNDTPACDGGVTDRNLLGCPDFTNVMFPTGDQETGLLSEGQLRVLRGSPIYRAKKTGPIVAPPRKPLPRIAIPSNFPAHLRRCKLFRRR